MTRFFIRSSSGRRKEIQLDERGVFWLADCGYHVGDDNEMVDWDRVRRIQPGLLSAEHRARLDAEMLFVMRLDRGDFDPVPYEPGQLMFNEGE